MPFSGCSLKRCIAAFMALFPSWNSELPLEPGKGGSHTLEMVEQRADNEATELRAK